MVTISVLYISSYPDDSQSSDKDQPKPSAGHSGSSSMAQTALVHHPLRHVHGVTTAASAAPRPDLLGPWSAAALESEFSSSDSLEAPGLNPEEQAYSE